MINVFKQQKDKIISFLLVVAMLFGVFSIVPMSAFAAVTSFEDSQGLTYTVNDDNTTVSVTGFNNSTTTVVIPNKVENNSTSYTVNNIDANTFKNNTNILSVKIPGTISLIATAAFDACSNLQSVELCEGVETISGTAFRNCTSLEGIIFPTTIKTINSNAFMGCSTLRSIEINSDLNLLAMSFRTCPNIEKVICNSLNISFNTNAFPNVDISKFTIYGYAGSTAETFASEKGYNFVKITVDTTILTKVLNEAKDLLSYDMYTADSYAALANAIKDAEKILEKSDPTAIEIENCVNELRNAISNLIADYGDTIFTWQKIDSGKSIEITGLQEAYKEESVLEIPSEIKGLPVTSIGTNAFNNNGSIREVVIPESVTVIKSKAFYSMNYITKITFSENSSLTRIEEEAFAAFTPQGYDTLSDIALPASLVSIGDKAFANRTNLLRVTVSSKEVEFGSDVFAENKKITIKGYSESTAEAYAGANGHSFSYLDLDVTGLKEALDKAQAIDKSLYTDESYSALNQAIRNANILLAQIEVNGTGSPSDVKKCLEALNDAMEALVLKETDATETTATETTEPTTNTTEPTSNPAPVYEEFILGDADGNGIVNIKDATYIQLYLANLLNEAVNPIPTLSACDVDGDGEVTIKDVTQIQLWLAKFNVDFKIGELVKQEINSTNPTTPSETDPTTATDPTTETDPTTATDPDSDTITFYVPNAVSWLTQVGGKMWIYNNATKEFMCMEYNEDDDCFYLDIPKEWSELSIYRTRYETTEETFDINKKWDEDAGTGEILNEWVGLGSRGDYDCYYITADGKGYYTMYESTKRGEDEYMRTIYFDNSKTKWSSVYIYGWNFGLVEEAIEMKHIEGTDIWSYTFVVPSLPIDGVEGFLFVSKYVAKGNWDNTAIQTGDLATEKGKDLFIPSGTGSKIGGSWDVYNP